MIEQVTKCDGCGKIRGEANHWLAGREGLGYYGLARLDDANCDPDQHFCSITCALKRLNEHLEAK